MEPELATAGVAAPSQPVRGESSSALLTDLYQLAMLEAYEAWEMRETAVFELFVRKLPSPRGFLVAAGLEQALDWLEDLAFTEAELEWLASSGRFSTGFVRSLAALRFTGDAYAMPEGTVFFPDEPILRVVAPLPQAQLVESRLMNIVHAQTLIASKAARFTLAAPDKVLVDFGMRRAHGAEAGMFAARASYLVGFTGSATVLAGQRYGVPVFGTMAHSFVQCHESEEQAFLDFARARPEGVTLLIDTYDTERGAERAVAAAHRLAEEGIEVRAVRLDSGDLGELARRVRRILDEGGCAGVGIFASGGLDEHAVARLVSCAVPIDGFGIGTAMDTSADAPSLDCAYKLQEYAGVARRKRSTGKATWPGRKQVFRRLDGEGRLAGDTLALESEIVEGTPLLERVMAQGTRIGAPVALETARGHAMEQIASLPESLRRLDADGTYTVEISDGVRSLAAEIDARD